MDINIDNLTYDELCKLSDAVYLRRRELARELVKGHPMSPDEKALVRDGKWIPAIKAYRERYGCTLMLAKAALDMYRAEIE